MSPPARDRRRPGAAVYRLTAAGRAALADYVTRLSALMALSAGDAPADHPDLAVITGQS